MKRAFHPEAGPKPMGPYSPAVRAGDFVFISGQGPAEPATNKLIEGAIFAQTQRTLLNLASALQSAGSRLDDVVKVCVHLADLGDFQEMNRAYSEFFSEPYPVRTTVQSGLLGTMLIEIDCIAYTGS